MKKILIQLILAFFLFGCNNGKSEKDLSECLIPFLSKFKILSDNRQLLFEGLDKNLPKLTSEDCIFLNHPEGGRALGLLPDTSNYYHLLWYQAVENGALMITTLNKKGNKIEERLLSSGQAGWDCGYQCHSTVYLLPNKKFILRDSIIRYECDMGVAPDSTWKFEIDSMIGKVSEDGKIKFSDLNKSELKLIKNTR